MGLRYLNSSSSRNTALRGTQAKHPLFGVEDRLGESRLDAPQNLCNVLRFERKTAGISRVRYSLQYFDSDDGVGRRQNRFEVSGRSDTGGSVDIVRDSSDWDERVLYNSKTPDWGEREAKVSEQLSKIQEILKTNRSAAHAAIRELSSSFPEHPKVVLEYANIERQKGNVAAASSLFSRVINICETTDNLSYEYVLALQGWASCEVRFSNPSRARALLEKSVRAARQLEQHSEKATVYGLHAWALVEKSLGNWSEARDLLQRAADIQPGNAVIHSTRAIMEADVNNNALARFNFARAATADPDDVKCWRSWALFEASMGKYRKMRHLFDRAYSLAKNDIKTLQAWAHREGLIGTAKSDERARKLYRRCLEVCPRSVFSWQSWARFEERHGNFEGARVLYEQALVFDPCDAATLTTYACLERKAGDYQKARKLLQAARDVDPFSASALMESGLVERALGNGVVAAEFFKRAMRLTVEKDRIKQLKMASKRKAEPVQPTTELLQLVDKAAREVSRTLKEMRDAAI